MKKKGQLEIGITMMVILVFLLLLIISLIVYFKFSYSEIRETNDIILEEKFSTLVNAITSMPEIKCSVKNAEKECLDAKKLVAFKHALDDNEMREYYIEEFGVKGIKIEIVYPPSMTSNGCNYGTYEASNDCGYYELFPVGSNELRYSTPVSIYYPDKNMYKIGKLTLSSNL